MSLNIVTGCFLVLAELAVLACCPEEFKDIIRKVAPAGVPENAICAVVDMGSKALRFAFSEGCIKILCGLTELLAELQEMLSSSLPMAQYQLRGFASSRLSTAGAAQAYTAIGATVEAAQAGLVFAAASCRAVYELSQLLAHIWKHELGAHDNGTFAYIRAGMAYGVVASPFIFLAFKLCWRIKAWVHDRQPQAHAQTQRQGRAQGSGASYS